MSYETIRLTAAEIAEDLKDISVDISATEFVFAHDYDQALARVRELEGAVHSCIDVIKECNPEIGKVAESVLKGASK